MAETQRPVAVLLMAMGGPDRLENVEAYLMDVRGGRTTSPELVEEIRNRYRVTGGKSPVLGITREVARALEQRLNRACRRAIPVLCRVAALASVYQGNLRQIARGFSGTDDWSLHGAAVFLAQHRGLYQEG